MTGKRPPRGRSPAPTGPRTRAALDRLLSERNEHPERLEEIDRAIHDAFCETRAILVLDMCGFSRLTMRHGIAHFLAMIHRLHGLVFPVVARHHGRVIKTDADNVFATFADAPQAVAAARDIHARLAEANVYLPEDWDLHASLGIGYGPTLLVGDDDLFGNEVNIASKLGEDVAGRGETLLTAAARGRLPEETRVEPRAIEVSAMTMTAFKLLD